MKRLLRAVCLVLCWTLLMAGMPGKASAEEAAPMVRVLLRRLQLTDRADLTLAGAYTVRVGGEDLMALPGKRAGDGADSLRCAVSVL